MTSQSKYWCFTINNPTQADAPEAWEGVLYLVYQEEVGADGHTPHLQGYVAFHQRKRLSTVKRLNARAHWEVRRGTHAEAKAYCMKEDTRAPGKAPVEIGSDESLGAQGKRNDLLSFKRAMDEKKTEREIAEDDELFPVWAKYGRVFDRYKRLKTVRARDWPTFTTILWGPPGTGKTRYVHEHAGPDAYWVKKPNGSSVFFDGYDGQEDVVIDEFYGWLPYDLLCRMCDRYPLMVDTKGGMVNFYPKRIWITSNAEPSTWYRRGLQALERRFNEPLGRVFWTPQGWNRKIPCCVKPAYFPTVEAVRAYEFAHQHCGEEVCLGHGPAPAPIGYQAPPPVALPAPFPADEDWLMDDDEEDEFVRQQLADRAAAIEAGFAAPFADSQFDEAQLELQALLDERDVAEEDTNAPPFRKHSPEFWL